MSGLRIRKKITGQAILETVIVLISLVLLAIVSVIWFSNLNLNQVHRIDLYRKTRVDAVNNPTRLLSITVNTSDGVMPVYEPKTFLKYYPDRGVDMEPGDDLDPVFFDDPRLIQAEVLLDKMDGILNVILPYRVTQAYNLNQTVYYHDGWQPPGYVPAVVSLINDTYYQVGGDPVKPKTEYAYRCLTEAIRLFKAVINDPLIPGPFDPDPNPLDYGLPDTAENRDMLLQSHTANRQHIQETINSLDGYYDEDGNWVSGAKRGIHVLIYGTQPPPTPPETPIDTHRGVHDYYLEFIRDKYPIVEWDWDGIDLSKHNKACKRLQELYDNIGVASSSIPTISEDLTDKIYQVHRITRPEVSTWTFTTVQQAKTIADQIAASAEVASIGGAFQQAVIGYSDAGDPIGLKPALDFAFANWSSPDPDIISKRNQCMQWAQNSAGLLKAYADEFNNMIGTIGGALSDTAADLVYNLYWYMKDLDTEAKAIEAKRQSAILLADPSIRNEVILRNVADRLDSDLESCIKNWDDDSLRNGYIEFARVNIWILYEVTDVNRLL